jgi:hypothetical protein
MLLKLVVAELGTFEDDEPLQLAVEALLALPLDAIPRDHRENLMSKITGYLVKRSRTSKSLQLPVLKAVAGLMVKLMRKSTFYDVGGAELPTSAIYLLTLDTRIWHSRTSTGSLGPLHCWMTNCLFFSTILS